MTGGAPDSRAPRASTSPRPPIVVGSATPTRASLILPVAHLVVGALVFAFAVFALAPLGPSAVWSGVIDSLQVVPSTYPGTFSGSAPTRAVALYLPKAPSARTFRLPPAQTALADSLHTGDTVQVILGWRSEADTAIAIRIAKNGGVLLDSAAVLAPQRRKRSLIELVGGGLALIGVIGLMRRRLPV